MRAPGRNVGRIRLAGRLAGWLAGAAIAAAAPGIAGQAPDEAPAPPVAASLYREQPRLMAEALGALRRGVRGEVELFAVLAAYYPNEGVFLREVEKIGPLLEERFGAEGRVVTLANSAEHPRRFPMANPLNLSAAIRAVADKMNLGEDVLLVYLTSHGVAEALSAGEWPAGTPPLLAFDLGRILDRAAVPNLVAVIGACRSGSFVPWIAAPDRLVVTAAAADRSSFGCSDKREWTYFGEAFFARALGETRSLPEAFARAEALVRQWETAAGFTPSEPQIAIGDAIGGALEALAQDAAR
jgi:Peptidase C13 family